MLSSSRTLHHGQDPYRLYPKQTLLHLQIFFDHVNGTLIPLYPQQQFQRWVEETSDKTTEELSLLYAVLALASTYSATTFGSFGKACAAAARAYAANVPDQTCLIFSHLLYYLALYDSVTMEYHLASSSVLSAIRTIADLGYHRELICTTFGSTPCANMPFRFTPQQTIECKRRTFWAGFVLDRLAGWAFQTRIYMVESQIDVRVPVDEDVYATGRQSQAPFFDNGSVHFRPTPCGSTSGISILAWLILITNIFGRAIEYQRLLEPVSFEYFRDSHASWILWIKDLLKRWADELPFSFMDTKNNLQDSGNWSHKSAFVTMHSLRFLATINVHYCFSRSYLQQTPGLHVEMAERYAHQYLRMCADAGKSRVPFDWTHSERLRGCLLFSPASMILHLTEDTTKSIEQKIELVLNVSAGTI